MEGRDVGRRMVMRMMKRRLKSEEEDRYLYLWRRTPSDPKTQLDVGRKLKLRVEYGPLECVEWRK